MGRARATSTSIDADGGRLHRITAERNGADRPAVDPVTGRIVFARWWRNHRFPLDRLDSKVAGDGFDWKDGLSAVRSLQLDGAPQNDSLLWRNAWQLATIRPDGTELAMWSGATDGRIADARNHVYGGAFAADGSFYGNFYPMFNMTEASGFGGIRRFIRGPWHLHSGRRRHRSLRRVRQPRPPVSYGIYRGAYATDAVALADGRLLASVATDPRQDYGLYLLERDGAAKTPVYDQVGTAEVRAVRASPRALPPLLADTVPWPHRRGAPAATAADGKFDGDGTFVFDALNVYFNAPVDWANRSCSGNRIGGVAAGLRRPPARQPRLVSRTRLADPARHAAGGRGGGGARRPGRRPTSRCSSSCDPPTAACRSWGPRPTRPARPTSPVSTTADRERSCAASAATPATP